jgi:hypothetical protein
VARAHGREFLIWRRWRSETKSSMELSMSFDLRVLRKVESEGAWPEIVDGMIGLYVLFCIAVGWYILSLNDDDVDGISFFAPSDSGGFRYRGNLSWVVCGSALYGTKEVAKCAISRCSTRETIFDYGVVCDFGCVSKKVSLRFMQSIVSCMHRAQTTTRTR